MYKAHSPDAVFSKNTRVSMIAVKCAILDQSIGARCDR